MALQGTDLFTFAGALALENFSEGFSGTALIAWMSSLTTFGYAATQYALLSSFYTILGKVLKGFSGVAVSELEQVMSLIPAWRILCLYGCFWYSINPGGHLGRSRPCAFED
jgi:PAT family beta-lactamase induction signal transducer AmpG